MIITLSICCCYVASADGSSPAEYTFDFTDSAWFAQNVVSEEYNSSIEYADTPSVLAGNPETKFSYMRADGGFHR